MKEKQKNRIQKTNTYLLISVLFIVISILFPLFVPKTARSFFPLKNQLYWDNFIDAVEKNNKIDPRTYWEFREFFSPGSFTYERNGLDKASITKTLNKINAPLNPTALGSPFAQFTSQRLTSLDNLTTYSSLGEVLTVIPPKEQVLFQDERSIIYKEDDGVIRIISIFSEQEMKQTVGFFDYQEKDLELTHRKYWLNITSLRLP